MSAADARVARLLAEAEIRRVLQSYVRGVDRLDLELVRSCYHPDATDSHGSFSGTVDEFVVWVERVLRRYDGTMHLLGAPLVEFDDEPDDEPTDDDDRAGHEDAGGRAPRGASVETYGLAFHWRAGGPPEHNLVTGFRYLDRFEARHDDWRIARRVAVTEWSRRDDEDRWWPIPEGMITGRRDRDDPVYRFGPSSRTRRGRGEDPVTAR